MSMRGGRGGWNNPHHAFHSGYPMGPRGFMRGGGRPPMFNAGFGNFNPHMGAPRHFGNFNGPSFGGMNAWSCDDDDDGGEAGGGGGFGPPPQDDFGGGGGGGGQLMVAPKQVLEWLDEQDAPVVRRVLYYCKWVLEQRGLPEESVGFSDLMQDGGGGADETPVDPDGGGGGGDDMSEWYEGEAASVDAPAEASAAASRGRGVKRPRPGLGFQRGGCGGGGGGVFNPSTSNGGFKGPMQWTRGGWAPKTNAHKITTTTARTLAEPDIIPPSGGEVGKKFPEASADRNKLKMLQNNVNMMSFELQKICWQNNIVELDKSDLTKYPEEARSRLQTAIQCVTAAEKTVADFREFLRADKYKDWNEEQKRQREESVKKMIGEMPQGTPHKKPEPAK